MIRPWVFSFAAISSLLDYNPPLPHARGMWKTFGNDTNLSENQIALVHATYTQVKDLPVHRLLVERAIVAVEKQDNRALYLVFDQGFKEMGPVYPLALIYCLYPHLETLYSRLGISNQVMAATLSDISIWVKTYERQHAGSTGLDRYWWICRHLCAKVLRLGRLQFEQGPFTFPFAIYYDSLLQRYRSFALGAIHCTFDGYIAQEEDADWLTTFSVKNGLLVGHEVDQSLGSISRNLVEVPSDRLLLVCAQTDPVTFVHIPEGEPLTPSLVDASLSEALEMFSPSLFVCDSWLLDPELGKALPPEGNICHFMNRFQKFPVAFFVPQIFDRVFGYGAGKEDVLAWKCTTSLQRQVQDHLRNGGVFRTMGGFIPNRARYRC